MARARNIKPGFFKNEELVELPFEVRLLFIGLWTLADREGRLEDRPKRIKMELFPADDVNVDAGLSSLEACGFLVRYEAGGGKYVQVENFGKHQMPHHKEVASVIPPPPGHAAITRCNSSKGNSTNDHRHPNVEPTLNQRSGNDGASCPSDSLIPDSLIPDSLIPEENLVEDSAESHDDAKQPKWTDDDERLAGEILDRVRDVAPSSKGSRKWPDDIRLMRERDGRTHAEIRDMFTWANSDSFWRANILSPAKLREKWPQLEAKRNNAKARASPAPGKTKQDMRADFMRQMNHGRNSETERVITGKAERVG